MLGILRFFLASCVVVFHLSAHVPNIGILAVNFFYVISGYLITMILNETYSFDFKTFFLNRFLRLYPTYYLIAAVALCLQFTTSDAALFHPSWSGHFQTGDWFGNALIFPWAVLPEPSPLGTAPDLFAFATTVPRYRIIPSTWSVGVEIGCYFLLWAGIARKPFAALLALIAAITWQIWLFQPGRDPGLHYAPITAALLPFSLGSLAFFVARRTRTKSVESVASTGLQLSILICVIVAFMINWRLTVKFDPSPFYGFFYYANSVLACAAVVALHGLKTGGTFGRFATWLGDLSYPVFLAQYVGGYIAWHLLGMPLDRRGWSIYLLGYAITVVMAIFATIIVDRPIKRIRSQIRKTAVGAQCSIPAIEKA